jgi:crotonobetainyl-CoA:carnitine CoA-transferase CaiB-like acyl-CoA transferase
METQAETAKPGPLAGIRVLDFSRILSGPYATQILADLGAEVIKTETIDKGDETRHFPPIRFSGQPLDGASPPALLGEQTPEILSRLLGIGKAEMEDLAEAGVLSRSKDKLEI